MTNLKFRDLYFFFGVFRFSLFGCVYICVVHPYHAKHFWVYIMWYVRFVNATFFFVARTVTAAAAAKKKKNISIDCNYNNKYPNRVRIKDESKNHTFVHKKNALSMQTDFGSISFMRDFSSVSFAKEFCWLNYSNVEAMMIFFFHGASFITLYTMDDAHCKIPFDRFPNCVIFHTCTNFQAIVTAAIIFTFLLWFFFFSIFKWKYANTSSTFSIQHPLLSHASQTYDAYTNYIIIECFSVRVRVTNVQVSTCRMPYV